LAKRTNNFRLLIDYTVTEFTSHWSIGQRRVTTPIHTGRAYAKATAHIVPFLSPNHVDSAV